MDLIKVERELSRNGAVESRLDKGGPPLGPPLWPAPVVLADSADAREDIFAAVDVFHGRLAEEEVHVVIVFHRAHEFGRCKDTENYKFTRIPSSKYD